MIYKISLSEDADVDIQNILENTLKDFGANQVLIYSSLIESAISDLEKEPYNIVSHLREEIALGARTYHIRHAGGKASHFILYRVNEDIKQIEIARVLHQKMDLKRHIPKALR